MHTAESNEALQRRYAEIVAGQESNLESLIERYERDPDVWRQNWDDDRDAVLLPAMSRILGPEIPVFNPYDEHIPALIAQRRSTPENPVPMSFSDRDAMDRYTQMSRDQLDEELRGLILQDFIRRELRARRAPAMDFTMSNRRRDAETNRNALVEAPRNDAPQPAGNRRRRAPRPYQRPAHLRL